MKPPFDRERVRIYLLSGAAYMLIRVLSDVSEHPEAWSAWAWNEAWRTVYIVAVNFILFEYTLPYLHRRRIVRSVLALAGQFLLYTFVAYGWRALGIFLHIHTPFKTYDRLTDGVCAQLSDGVGSIVFFALIRHIYGHIRLRQAAQQLRIEKQQAELNYLKAQTNPHFLFNTLNNIYSLAQDKSDLAPESILRLSKILRFMLYETGAPTVSIEQEIKIMHDYIALEKLRYDDSLRVDFRYVIDNLKQPLPPLLLIPLVENAFKHGISETRLEPFIEIQLSVVEQQLAFYVKNSTGDGMEKTVVRENIGLSNLRRQLELLYTDYTLAVEQGAAAFTATLKINLESHVQNNVYYRRG